MKNKKFVSSLPVYSYMSKWRMCGEGGNKPPSLRGKVLSHKAALKPILWSPFPKYKIRTLIPYKIFDGAHMICMSESQHWKHSYKKWFKFWDSYNLNCFLPGESYANGCGPIIFFTTISWINLTNGRQNMVKISLSFRFVIIFLSIFDSFSLHTRWSRPKS